MFDGNQTAMEWEVAEAEDFVGNTFTYLRNRWSGLLIEFNHVRCGTFRFSPRNERIDPDHWAVPAPYLADASASLIPPSESTLWRCPLVPEAFAAARSGRRPGEPSVAPAGPPGPDPGECAARNYDMAAEVLAEQGVHAGRVRIWPGSPESAARTAELAARGLVLVDRPAFARPAPYPPPARPTRRLHAAAWRPRHREG
jgi:hypothetical protein